MPGQLKKELFGRKTTRFGLQKGGLDFASWTPVKAGLGDNKGARERKIKGAKRRTKELKQREEYQLSII